MTGSDAEMEEDATEEEDALDMAADSEGISSTTTTTIMTLLTKTPLLTPTQLPSTLAMMELLSLPPEQMHSMLQISIKNT